MISLFKCASEFGVDDASDSVCGQKADHSHSGGCGVEFGDEACPAGESFSLAVVDVQSEQVEGGGYDLYEEGTGELRYHFAGAFGVVCLFLYPLAEDGGEGEGGGDGDDVSEEEEEEGAYWEV